MIALVTALRTDPAVSAIVGDRIYPQVMPDEPVVPALVYTLISNRPQNSLEGYTSGQMQAIVQIDCYTMMYGDAQLLADAVQDLLGTARVVPGIKGWVRDRRDDYEDDSRFHRVSMDIAIWRE